MEGVLPMYFEFLDNIFQFCDSVNLEEEFAFTCILGLD